MTSSEYEKEATMTVSDTEMPERVRTGDLYGLLRTMKMAGKQADVLKKQLMYAKVEYPNISPRLNSLANVLDDYEEHGTEQPKHIIGVLHGYLGLTSELGEIAETLSHSLEHRVPLDRANLKEELGDANWYMVRMLKSIGHTFVSVWTANINKLRGRHGKKFKQEAGLEEGRDRENEKRLLEGS